MIRFGSAALPRRVLAIGTGLVALYLILLTSQRALDAYRAQQEVSGVRQQIVLLRAHNLELQTELTSGRLDDEIERIAREELGLIRPGDKPLTLLWPEPALPEVDPARDPRQLEPNWLAWMRHFVDVDPPRTR